MATKKQTNFSAYLPDGIREKIKELRAAKPHLISNQALVIYCIMTAYALEKNLNEGVKND